MRLARGWLWLAREGASDVVFELYVPRVEDQSTRPRSMADATTDSTAAADTRLHTRSRPTASAE